MYRGTITPTLFGRNHAAEPLRPALQHLYRGAPLKPAQWQIPFGPLDQEDLLAQNIDTSQLIPGAPRLDALGSCTANATMASFGERWLTSRGTMLGAAGLTMTDPVRNEKLAITFYHECTTASGDPAQEWPPADCGSTGLACCQLLENQGLISSWQTGTGGHALASMLQQGSVIIGMPWFQAWMTPGTDGFIDGDGSAAAYDQAAASGLAGGHEVCAYQLPRVTGDLSAPGDLQESWVQCRNSWSASWGLAGDFRIHLSTVDRIAQYSDLKQFVL